MSKLWRAVVAASLLLSLAAPAWASQTYVVQAGDTLYKISVRFGVDVSAIMAANGLTNPNLIFLGQTLIIPDRGTVVSTPAPSGSTPTPPPSGGTGGTYVVQAGDWLSRIAARLGVSLGALMAANGLTNPNLIYIGQQLAIPGANAPAPTPTPAPSGATPTPAPSTGTTGGVYIVQSGDWLSRIASRLGVSLAALMSANGLTNANLIYVGQRLVVPGASAPAPTATPAPGGATPVPPPAGAAGFELGGQVASFSAVDKMKYAGMMWVKRQVRWTPGDNPSGDVINDAHSKGFKVLLSVLGDPASISGGANFDSYAAYVGGLAALGADAIEIWNEMNLDREWPAGQINPVTYTDLLRRSYTAIKGRNANTLVISGAPSPTGAEGAFGLDRVWNDDRYIGGLVNAGAANYMDCIGVHYNEGILSPTQATGDSRGTHYTRYYPSMVNLYYNAFGGRRPLCFTELGYLSPEGYGPLPASFGWGGSTTVAQQAQWLAEAASLSRSSGKVRLMIIFNVDFTVYGDDPQAGFAIIRPGGNCPACETLHNVTGGR